MKKRFSIKYHSNPYNKGSITNKMRKERLKIFEDFFIGLFKERIDNNEKVKILDIGGTYNFWETMDFRYIANCQITLVNIHEILPSEGKSYTNIVSIKGDATNLLNILDKSYDLVFSNSCIEHVGKEPEWHKMATEMKRVADHFFLQTPNKYFPIEPHFMFPFFQYFPVNIRALFIRCFRMQFGSYPRGKDWKDALLIADSIKLLSYKDLRELFPNANIEREQFLVFTKSFMVFE